MLLLSFRLFYLNFYFLWFLIELSSFLFMFYFLIININKEPILTYFIVQEVRSIYIFISFFFFSYTFIFFLSKIAIFPFHNWLLKIRVNINIFSLFIILNLQKFIPLNLIYIFIFSDFTFYLIFLNFFFALISFSLSFIINYFLSLLSIFRTRLFFLILIMNKLLFLLYFVFYTYLNYIFYLYLDSIFFVNINSVINLDLLFVFLFLNIISIPPSFMFFIKIKIFTFFFLIKISSSLILFFFLIILLIFCLLSLIFFFSFFFVKNFKKEDLNVIQIFYINIFFIFL